MHRKKKQLSKRQRSRDKGFVIPIVLGFGFLLLIIGLTIVLKSQGDQITASSQKASANSEAVAELGITRFQNLINSNRVIADYPACTTWNTDGSCADTATKSWKTASNSAIWPEFTAAACGEGSTTSAATVVTMATRTWQDIDLSDSSKGQFRLVDYTYSPSAGAVPGTGILTVEGRVQQSGSGTTATSVSGTATVRLAVNIPVNAAISSSQFPGLWLQTSINTGASGGVSINASFRDSSADGSATTALQSYLHGSQQLTPGCPFPALPAAGLNPPTAGPGVYLISAVSLSGSGTSTLPQTGDTPVNGMYTYNIGAAGGKSINLSGSSYVTVGAGTGDTVVLYLQGGIQTSGGTKISLTPNSKMILYVNGDVNLSGGSATNPPPIVNSGGPENAQVYVYGSRTVQLSGGSQMNAFIFGPNSQVNTMSGGANVSGSIWVNSWQGSGSAFVNQATVNQSALNIQMPGSIAIGAISAWQRQNAQ